jgi:NADH-quinone oxidoreductase subunit J
MSGNQFMFYLFAAVIVVFSILSVTSRKILRAATFLLFVLVATSGLFFMVNYQFLAAVQLTLYAGGIVVLIIFSILLTSHINEKFEPIKAQKSIFSAVAAIAGAVLCIITILDYKFKASEAVVKELDMQIIGKALMNYNYNGYILPFEVISVLLLAAMIASIVIAKKIKK